MGSAISAYNTGLESDPTNTDILHNKASVLNRLGRLEDAHACQERIHALQNPLPVETKSPVEEQQQIIHDSHVPIPWNRKVIQNLKKFDLLALRLFVFGLPLVLLAIYVLPLDVKVNYFILELRNPTLAQVFLSNYTHIKVYHVVSNIVMFIACMFVIQMFESRKRVFLLSYLVFLLALPFFITFISSNDLLANYPDIVYSMGASGFVAAFMGYAFVAMIMHVYENRKTKKDILFVVFLLIAAVYVAYALSFNETVAGGMTSGLVHLMGFMAGMIIPWIIRIVEPAIPPIKMPIIAPLTKTKSVTMKSIIGPVTLTGSQSTRDYLNKILVETEIADKPTDN